MDNPAFHSNAGAVWCEDVRLAEVAERFGTPVYVYSRRAILDNLAALAGAFGHLRPLVCFSVKANSNLAVLEILARAGAGADVVSGGELYRARKAGVPGDRIVFAGVGKNASEIEAALEASVLSINCESDSELDLIEDVARSRSTVAPVTLRINPGVTAGGHDYIETGHDGTKFGIPAAHAPAAFERMAVSRHLRAVGIGTHIGSQILTVEPFVRAAALLRELVMALRHEGVELDLIDLGGGLGITYGDEQPPPPGRLAQALEPHLEDLGLRLVLEPGRFIAGNAGALIGRVEHVKTTASKSFVVVDAAMNDLIRPSLYNARHRIEHAIDGERPTTVADIVGPICESGDFLGRDVEIGSCRRGDLLVVWSAGAYAASMASNYNSRPRAPEVLIEGSRMRLIRRRETYEDLVRAELDLPESAAG